jgi:uncharacterized protein YuzE
MDNLASTFPVLVETIAVELTSCGRPALASQLRGSTVLNVSYDGNVDAGYIALEPWQETDVLDREVLGVRYARAVGLRANCQAYLDIDNLDRVMGIELLYPPPELIGVLVAHSVV